MDPSSPGYRPDGVEALKRIADRRSAFPPLVEQAGNLAGAVGRFVASGGEMATGDERTRRLAICATCPEFIDGRCRLCGCLLVAKVRSSAEHCPIERW